MCWCGLIGPPPSPPPPAGVLVTFSHCCLSLSCGLCLMLHGRTSWSCASHQLGSHSDHSLFLSCLLSQQLKLNLVLAAVSSFDHCVSLGLRAWRIAWIPRPVGSTRYICVSSFVSGTPGPLSLRRLTQNHAIKHPVIISHTQPKATTHLPLNLPSLSEFFVFCKTTSPAFLSHIISCKCCWFSPTANLHSSDPAWDFQNPRASISEPLRKQIMLRDLKLDLEIGRKNSLFFIWFDCFCGKCTQCRPARQVWWQDRLLKANTTKYQSPHHSTCVNCYQVGRTDEMVALWSNYVPMRKMCVDKAVIVMITLLLW